MNVKPLKASLVMPNLYMRARTNGTRLEALMAMRREYQLYRVICLTNRADEDWQYCHVKYDHWPMADSTTQLPDWLARRVGAVANDVDQGLATLVYCESGRNRSGLFCALVAREVLGLTGHEAIKVVRAARPGALQNRFFVHFLEGLPRYGNG